MLSLAKRLHSLTLTHFLSRGSHQLRSPRPDDDTHSRRRQKSPPLPLKKAEKMSEWWIVDGEMHGIGDNVPPRERFVIPRENIPNKRRKQLRKQFMRMTRLVLKESDQNFGRNMQSDSWDKVSLIRNSNIFSPLAQIGNDENLAKSKEKGITITDELPVVQRQTIPDEMKEFQKLIKKSDYGVVDKLNHTSSKISILSLLLSSAAHIESLLKVLSVAHVIRDISVGQFDGVVANLTAGNCLGFSDDELPPEGKNHNNVLHISVKCVDTILSRVIVDIGSCLNIISKTTLMKLAMERTYMKPSTLMVKAFDGSKTTVIGEVDLPIKIGSQVFIITFQVMDIHLNYNCMLGRPWIHASGAVTSTLHQKLKFSTGDKVIVVDGE